MPQVLRVDPRIDETATLCDRLGPFPRMTGDEFRAWRLQHGWTQATTATLFGVTERTVRSWESVAGDLPRTIALSAAYLAWRALDIRRIPTKRPRHCALCRSLGFPAIPAKPCPHMLGGAR